MSQTINVALDTLVDCPSNQTNTSDHSTLVYENMQKIVPIQVSENIWIGPLCYLETFGATNILNLTSTKLSNYKNVSIINLPMSSSNFQQFIKIIPKCIDFIDNSKAHTTERSYICCRNGYSRALVALSVYKLYRGEQSVSKLLHFYNRLGLSICQEYINYLKMYEKIINPSKKNILLPIFDNYITSEKFSGNSSILIE